MVQEVLDFAMLGATTYGTLERRMFIVIALLVLAAFIMAVLYRSED